MSDDGYSYVWGIENHDCSKQQIIDLVTSDLFEFEHDPDDQHVRCFQRTINDWKAMKIRVDEGGAMKIALHWMGDTTNERYFDYLINCAHISGQLMVAVEVNHYGLLEAFELFARYRSSNPRELVGDIVDAYAEEGEN